MNKGTVLRTVLRVAFSIYSALCVWQATINSLGEQIGIPWLAIICAVAIVISGLIVDVITTYFNNDYTEEGCAGTAYTRQLKQERGKSYIGDRFFTDNDSEGEEDNEQDGLEAIR